MAGIYIHIPFCKQACSYCNFHFSTTAKHREEIVAAMLKEIEHRADFFNGEAIKSIYLGGGTPSILNQAELSSIFKQLESHFNLNDLKEVTLEANPDDLSKEKLRELKELPINRLSIGIQSFHQKDLDFMNRAHSAEEGIATVKRALDMGFEKLSLDLIFGIPTSTTADWEANLRQIFSLDFDHLSAYALTLEEGTLFHHQVKSGKAKEIEDREVAEQYNLLQDYIKNESWEQYELSNYCRNEQYAIHNTAYWMNEKYLGIGPAAHSYDGAKRRWNLANNHLYYKHIHEGKQYYETEQLSEIDRYHELLISRLRTKWGIPKTFLEETFSSNILEHFTNKLSKLSEYFEEKDDRYQIKRAFWFTSDNLLEQLMVDS
ncbi:MAG: coproporphyrinogen III oxidase [Flavobacteriales bacterium]|nr:coproporphyrinogen III oxidase [Flavobacteriales bacterium]|tara:strand:+ start:186 stop:1310 length:1125 start_codon:yes stop_codon:yes gene_type:complete